MVQKPACRKTFITPTHLLDPVPSAPTTSVVLLNRLFNRFIQVRSNHFVTHPDILSIKQLTDRFIIPGIAKIISIAIPGLEKFFKDTSDIADEL
jgi:hypothetical protein